MSADPFPPGVRFVAVVGSQRSGTTLTGQSIGAHSRALLLDEDDGLYGWTSSRLGGRFVPRRAAVTSLPEVCARAGRKYLEPERRVDAGGGLAPGIDTLVLKAPNLTLEPGLVGALPGAVAVCVRRSVLDTVASMLRLNPDGMLANQLHYLGETEFGDGVLDALADRARDDTLGRHLRLAAIATLKMSFGVEFRRAGVPVVEIEYETLVAAPEHEMERVYAACGLEPETGFLQPGDVFVGIGPGGTERRRPPDTVAVGRHSGTLEPSEIADIERLLRRAGVEPDTVV